MQGSPCTSISFPNPIIMLTRSIQKTALIHSFFTESSHSRELTDEAFHRRQHVFRILQIARQGTQLYGQVKQEQVVKR